MKKVCALLLAFALVCAVFGIGLTFKGLIVRNDDTNSTADAGEVPQDNERVDEDDNSETTLPMEEETIPLIVTASDASVFYYNQLNDTEKEYYRLIGEKMDDFIHNIPVCLVEFNDEKGFSERESAERALKAYRLDNPISSIWLNDTKIVWWWISEKVGEDEYIKHKEGFYVAPYGIGYSYGLFHYVNSEYDVPQMIQKVEEKTQVFVQTLDGLNNRQKVVEISRWLIEDCKYVNMRNYPNDGNLYGPIVGKYGRCAGDSMAFKYVCDMAEVPCIIVEGVGFTPRDGKTIEEFMTEREEMGNYGPNHAWNATLTEEGWTVTDNTNNRDIQKITSENPNEDDEEVVYATDSWLLIDQNTDIFMSTHALCGNDRFQYPE